MRVTISGLFIFSHWSIYSIALVIVPFCKELMSSCVNFQFHIFICLLRFYAKISRDLEKSLLDFDLDCIDR